MSVNRRKFLITGLTASTVVAAGRLPAQETNKPGNVPDRTTPAEVVRKRGPQELEQVYAFVGAGHRDLARVKEMITQDPKLVFAARDWGGGDWETALGGASHTGHREIAKYLLAQGARIDSFCASMLGERDLMLALLKAEPSIVTTKGPHGYTLLYHVAISGDLAVAEAMKPLLPANAKDYNQALTAAARDGHLSMTKWLLENGVTDPNAPDGFNKTALAYAIEKKFPEVEAELRSHGVHEKTRGP